MVYRKLLVKYHPSSQKVANCRFNGLEYQLRRQRLIKLCRKLKLSNLFAKVNGHNQTVLIHILILVKWQVFHFKSLVRQEPKIAHGLHNFWIEVLLL